MTIKELIEKLRAYDRDTEVYIGEDAKSCDGRCLETVNFHEDDSDKWVTLIASE